MINFTTGPQAKHEKPYIAACRLHQSIYRAEILKEEFGYGPTKNAKNKYGNMLINGEVTGSNFISKEAFRFAKERVHDKQTNKNILIEEYRLFNNMLSSMPMCFNMLADLRQLLINDPQEAHKVLRASFPELKWAYELIYVDVEFIPVDIENYTNDKSAFDGMLLVKDQNGKKGLISIETKYTDVLGDNVAKDKSTKNDLIDKYKIFKPEYADKLKSEGYKQIHRNYLLTYAYAKRNKTPHFANVVISPSFDPYSNEEIEEVINALSKQPESLFKIDLETYVERNISKDLNSKYIKIMKRFKQRYLLKV
jgi:DNA polymerase IIIc chi subunit